MLTEAYVVSVLFGMISLIFIAMLFFCCAFATLERSFGLFLFCLILFGGFAGATGSVSYTAKDSSDVLMLDSCDMSNLPEEAMNAPYVHEYDPQEKRGFAVRNFRWAKYIGITDPYRGEVAKRTLVLFDDDPMLKNLSPDVIKETINLPPHPLMREAKKSDPFYFLIYPARTGKPKLIKFI